MPKNIEQFNSDLNSRSINRNEEFELNNPIKNHNEERTNTFE